MRLGGWLVLVAAALAVFGVVHFDSEVTDAMGRGAAALFHNFEDEQFPLLLAAVLLAVALGLLLSYAFFVVIPKSLHLHELQKFVRNHEGNTEFAAEFQSISDRLSKSKLIGHAWREFEETLVIPDSAGKVVQNTTRPQTFINYGCAQDLSPALRYMPHIPNYFVGVGLLLTFVGLVAALHFANTAVGGDVNQAVDGLKDLLAAATFKFWTSIAGLLASIVLSFFFRYFTLHLEHRFARLCRVIERGMAFATPQRIFVDVRDTIQEQLAETKKINTEVAMSIADGVGRQFKEHVPPLLADAMQPLVDAVQETSRNVGQGANEGLEKMVNEFAETMEGSAGRHMREISDTLQTLQQSLSSMQSSMDTSGDDFARRMTEGAEQLDSTMREVAESMRELVDSLKSQFGEAGQVLGSSMQECLEKLTRQSEEMGQRIAEQSRNASSAFAEEITKAAKALSESADDSARTSVEFAEQLRTNLGDSVSGVRHGLDQLSRALSSLDEQLGKQGEEMATVAARSRETAQAMETAATSVRSGIGPFQEIGRSLNESGKSLERSVGEIANRIDNAVQVVEGVSGSLEGVAETIEGAWESYRERFEGVDEDLERTFTKLQEAVEQQQQQVQAFVQKLDASFEKALSSLSGGIDGINEGVEDLTEALRLNGQAGPAD